MVGGRDHTSHRLVALGVSERTAVLTLYALASAGAFLAIGLGRLPLGPTLAAVFLYAMVVVAIGIVLGSTTEPAADGDASTAPPLISDIAQRRRVYEVLADTGLLAIAYYAAFRLRFQGADFDVFFPPFVRSLPIVIGLQVAGLYSTGKYRQVWRSVSAAELGTLIKGLALGLTGSVLFVLFVFRFERFSRGVFVIDALVAWFFLVGARAVTSGIDSYLRKVRVRGTPCARLRRRPRRDAPGARNPAEPGRRLSARRVHRRRPAEASNASRRHSGARRRRQPGGRRRAP